MAFPASPAVNQVYTAVSGVVYKFSGKQWLVVPGGNLTASVIASASTGDIRIELSASM